MLRTKKSKILNIYLTVNYKRGLPARTKSKFCVSPAIDNFLASKIKEEGSHEEHQIGHI